MSDYVPLKLKLGERQCLDHVQRILKSSLADKVRFEGHRGQHVSELYVVVHKEAISEKLGINLRYEEGVWKGMIPQVPPCLSNYVTSIVIDNLPRIPGEF